MNYEVYGEYRDSKLTWLGNIPNDWEIERLGYHSTIITGHPFNSDLFSTEGIPLIRIRDLKEENTTLFWNNDYPNYAIINNGDLLVGMDGDFDVVSWKGKKALLNQRIFKINAKNKLLDNYLKYILQIPITHINELTMSTTVKHLSVKDVNDIKIPLPSKNEQKQIANYLDKKTSKIDTTIAKNKELINLLEEKRTALINQVVTKGLNPEVPMKDSGIEWIGEIPEHWDIVPFKRLFNNIKDGTHGSFQRVSDGEPLLSAKNVFNDSINISENESLISEDDYRNIVSNGFPRKKDLLLTIVGTIGRSCVYDKDYPLAFQRSVAFIRLTHDNPYFYNYFIKSDLFYSQLMINAKESAQKGVYLNDIKKCFVIRPPFEIQTEIANYLNNEILKINKTITKIKENIGLLEEYKTSLIHHVVTGKIDVRGEEI